MTSMPLRIGGELVKEARVSASLFHRSITQQIEHWATIGARIDSALSASSVAKIKSYASPDIERVLAKVASPAGKKRALAFLAKKKGSLYGSDPATPHGVIAHHKNGKSKRGRMVNGEFVPTAK